MEQVPKNTAVRRNYIDTMKGIGIICVVIGHLCEYHRGTFPQVNAMFECIYLFHMALFCIASGLVARFNPWKIVSQQIWLYILCQVGITAFRIHVLQEDLALNAWWDVLTPWRHMWYLYALIFWSLTVPFLRLAVRYIPPLCRLFVFCAAVAIGLISGEVSWPYSLDRVFSFFPFFAFGVLFSNVADAWNALAHHHPLIRIELFAILFFLYGRAFYNIVTAPEPVYEGVRLFQDSSYFSAGYTMQDRAAFYVIGFLTVFLLMGVVGSFAPLAALGKRTLPVYILHMPLYTLMIQYGFYSFTAQAGKTAIIIWLVFFVWATICVCSSYPIYAAIWLVSNIWYKLLPKLVQAIYHGIKRLLSKVRQCQKVFPPRS